MKNELTDEQKECLSGFDRDMAVIAGAGSGKTRVLAERYVAILRGNLATENGILTITFTEKAAAEMEERIRALLGRSLKTAWISTIHAFCSRLLRENAVEAEMDPHFTALDEAESAIFADAAVLDFFREESGTGAEDVRKLLFHFGPVALRESFTALYQRRGLLRVFLRGQKGKLPELTGMAVSAFGRFEEWVRKRKRRNAVLDFDDLLLETESLLQKKSAIREKISQRFRFVMVDEFQDIDRIQANIISLASQGKEQNLFIVGDPNQSIYGFRDSDVSLLAKTRERIRSRGGVEKQISTCHRTAREGIEFFNYFFARVLDGGEDRPGAFETRYNPMKPSKDRPAGFTVEFIDIPGEEKVKTGREKEAAAIAGRIRCLHGSYKLSEIAILFRAMTDVKKYEKALMEKGVPFYTVAGAGFYGKQEINDVLNAFKVACGTRESAGVALAGVLRSPLFALSDEALYHVCRQGRLWPLVELPELPEELDEKLGAEAGRAAAAFRKIREWRELACKMTLTELIGEITDSTGYSASVLAEYGGEQKLSNLFKLKEVARRFQKKTFFRPRDFIDYVDEVVAKEVRESEAQVETESDETVKLMTIHKAKGLEFEVVIIPDIARKHRADYGTVVVAAGAGPAIKPPDDGLFPADTELYKNVKEEIQQREAAETKRLFYVAMTRAKSHLIISAAGGSGKEKGWYKLFAEVLGGKDGFSYGLPGGGTKSIKVIDAGETPEQGRLPGRARKKFNADQSFRNAMPLPAGTRIERIAVTHIISYAGCPRRFYYRHVLGIPEVRNMDGDSAARDRLTGAERGTLVHSILADWDYRTLPGDDRMASMVRNAAPDMPEDAVRASVPELRAKLAGFLSSTVCHEIAEAERESEVPFFMNLHGAVLEGKMDLVYRRGGKTSVVDYKTDRDADGALEGGYPFQLQLYALCLNEAGRKVDEAYLYFLENGRKAGIDISRSSLAKAKVEAEGIISSINEGKFPVREEKCPHCVFKPLCQPLCLDCFRKIESRFNCSGANKL